MLFESKCCGRERLCGSVVGLELSAILVLLDTAWQISTINKPTHPLIL